MVDFKIHYNFRFTRDTMNHQLLEDSRAQKQREAEEQSSFYEGEDEEEEQ